MGRIPTFGISGHRRVLVVTMLGIMVVAGMTVTAEPDARHWSRVVLRRAIHKAASLRTVVRHKASIAIAVVKSSPKAPPDAVLDGRFVAKSSAEAAARFSAVTSAGFIGLPPSGSVAGHDPSFELEHASLAAAPLDASPQPVLAPDFATARAALTLYRKGAIGPADDFVRTINDPLMRTTLEWVALRFNPRDVGAGRLQSFVAAHPDWPMTPWLKRRIEEDLVGQTHDPASIAALFSAAKPQTLAGRLALARADAATGSIIDAAAIVRDVWRNADITSGEAAAILHEFGGLIGRDDHKYRADRLLYKEDVPNALGEAALAGPDVRLLAVARASVINLAGSAASDAAIAAVPKALANDPGLTFSRIQKLRRAGRINDAAALMAEATNDPSLLIDGDEWWVERRLIARKLLDVGDAKTAYRVCADHAALSDASNIEAEFHAGWIALRFLDDPKNAAVHFARVGATAETPISRARAAYWQGRAAEAANEKDRASAFYTAAAAQSISYYGQLASGRLGRSTIDLRQPVSAANGDDRREAIRVIEQLYALGERDVALPLAFEIAKTEASEAQVAALTAILTKMSDARATLIVGKLATQRGMAFDETAFPTFGIPDYQPLTNSADRAVVYAIARQESEFDAKSVSRAGAKGLMQLIAPTARQTALKLGVSFDETRLLSDAAFNAQIGAAHLGQLLSALDGSYILTFAAYNAGPRRVQEWVDAYGDPRKAGVDPIDWVERIPFTETRNYVQRVLENLQIYRLRFGQSPQLLVGANPAAPGKGT